MSTVSLSRSASASGPRFPLAEGLFYQDIDISQCVEPKQFHDIVGYYNRFDVFELNVTRKRLSPIAFSDEDAERPVSAPSTRPTAN